MSLDAARVGARVGACATKQAGQGAGRGRGRPPHTGGYIAGGGVR